MLRPVGTTDCNQTKRKQTCVIFELINKITIMTNNMCDRVVLNCEESELCPSELGTKKQ